jgi:hypothetical protein
MNADVPALFRRYRGRDANETRGHTLGVSWVGEEALATALEERSFSMGSNRRYGGISLGGILVIIGIVVAFAWSLILGLIIAIVGLIAFGGFVRGKWY